MQNIPEISDDEVPIRVYEEFGDTLRKRKISHDISWWNIKILNVFLSVNTVPITIQVELGSGASNASVLLVCDSNIVEERNKSPGHYILDEK